MWFPALGTLFGFTNDDVIAIGTRDRAANQQNVFRFTDLNDFEILAGALDLAHVTGHAHGAHDRSWKQARADRAGAAVPTLCAVRSIASRERMAANRAFKAAPFGHTDSVNVITGSKQRCADNVTGFHFFGEVAKLFNAFYGCAIEFFDVA